MANKFIFPGINFDEIEKLIGIVNISLQDKDNNNNLPGGGCPYGDCTKPKTGKCNCDGSKSDSVKKKKKDKK